MADTRSTPKADDPAMTTAAGLSTADTTTTSGAAGRSRTEGILKAGKDEALTEAKAMMRDAVDEQRRRAAGAVGSVAGALRKAAGDLGNENETVGRYTDMAAQRLDEVADYLRSSNFDDVLAGAEDMARRQPYWFIGGAMAAGFLVARMVKGSVATQPRLGTSERYGQRMASSSAAGYGTSTEAGLYPPGPATTAPISSASTGSASVGSAGATPGGSGSAATPRTEI